MNADHESGVTPPTDSMCSPDAVERHIAEEARARTDKLLERRGAALGSILTLAPDDFAQRYQALFQSAVQGG